MSLLELNNIRKFYGQLEALKGISLSVNEGGVGLLGPNGAGKSTLIRILLGLLDFDEGSATLLDHSIPAELDDIKPEIGYMPEHDCLIPDLNAVDFVAFMARLSGLPQSESVSRAHESLEYVGLEEARYRKINQFSGGMKQRVKLAQAIVHGPEVVFLDEPTNGLDPTGREQMLSLIEDIQSRQISTIFSSHILPDIEEVCDQIIILQDGTLQYSGSLSRLTSRDESLIEIKTNHQNDEFAEILVDRGFELERTEPYIELKANRIGEASQTIFEIAETENIQIRHFLPSHLTLEKAFLEMMDRPN